MDAADLELITCTECATARASEETDGRLWCSTVTSGGTESHQQKSETHNQVHKSALGSFRIHFFSPQQMVNVCVFYLYEESSYITLHYYCTKETRLQMFCLGVEKITFLRRKKALEDL